MPDLLGWCAAVLMVATFACRDACRMRPLAVATNLAFIGYGIAASLPPVLALHALLLPVNLWRWAEAWHRRCAPARQGVGCRPMATPGLRSARERVIQTLAFEGVGLLVVAPLFAWVTGHGGGESFAVVAAVSVAVMAWAALYNTAFDAAEWRLTGRVASDRPHGLRTLHALGLGASSAIVTTPLIWALTDLGWWGALAVDLGLAAAYALYGYAFHWVYDRLRPVPLRST